MTYFGEEVTLPPFPISLQGSLKGGNIYGRLKGNGIIFKMSIFSAATPVPLAGQSWSCSCAVNMTFRIVLREPPREKESCVFLKLERIITIPLSSPFLIRRAKQMKGLMISIMSRLRTLKKLGTVLRYKNLGRGHC